MRFIVSMNDIVSKMGLVCDLIPDKQGKPVT